MINHEIIEVKKHSGCCENFSLEKLENSLAHTCIDKNISKEIAKKITKTISSTTSTEDIFKNTNKLLKEKSFLAAAQYSLKRSLFDLGPEGHNFESFVARYFLELGYKTQTCQIFQGKFVKHEIDVVAEKDSQLLLAECKFHNRLGVKNDIKVALYVKARWDDVILAQADNKIKSFYLITNTSFTKDAITYANGNGLKLLGVNAPEKVSFLDEVKSLKLYPVTSLSMLDKSTVSKLIKANVFVAKDLLENQQLLCTLGLNEIQMQKVIEEVNLLTKN